MSVVVGSSVEECNDGLKQVVPFNEIIKQWFNIIIILTIFVLNILLSMIIHTRNISQY